MQKKIDETILGLKDFQKKSVDYAMDLLYNKGANKILIADEVGLGKTIVAKGIIAKAYEKYLSDGGATKANPTFNVIYICSNLALASQNIQKLNFLGESSHVDTTVNRLIYLSFKSLKTAPNFMIHSLTPGTSFEDRSHQGEAKERAIIFCLLSRYSVFQTRRNGLKWLLKGHIQDIKKWEAIINYVDTNPKQVIREDLYGKFRIALMKITLNVLSNPKLYNHFGQKNDITFWQALLDVSKDINHNNYHKFLYTSEIIRTLRRELSKLCLEYLGADIFILDEFQRYSKLLKTENETNDPVVEIARVVFSIPDAKILMLSATPFKPYTNDIDEIQGENHQKEFDDVLKFLMGMKTGDEKWTNFQSNKKDFFSYLRKPSMISDSFEKVHELKTILEDGYKQVMIRTERSQASEDRNTLICDVLKERTRQTNEWSIDVSIEDIEDFVSINNLTEYLNTEHNTRLPVPIEYVKSSPFAFSFLHNYQHSKKLEELLQASHKELEVLVRKTRHAWLNMNNIDGYKDILTENKLPNAKLRLLVKESIDKGGWKYLWVPPSIEYYAPEGAFRGSQGFSKSLVFSSWLLVPRMISTLISYEVERNSIGKLNKVEQGEATYFKKNKKDKRKPLPQFTYARSQEDSEPKRMNNIIYLYPCVSLANLYEPSKFIATGSLTEIKKELRAIIKIKLEFIVDKYSKKDEQLDYAKWYWAAPLLLDKEENNKLISSWLLNSLPVTNTCVDADEEIGTKIEDSGKKQHFDLMSDLFHTPQNFKLPNLLLSEVRFKELVDFITELALGSPAISFLRSINKHFSITASSLDASFQVASSFVTLFNKPESIATVKLTTKSAEYLDKVLEYSIDGNIQAMLDEYVYLLYDCENLKQEQLIANHLADILSVRTSTVAVDDLETFVRNAKNGTNDKRMMRTHYAMDFGNQKMDNSAGRKQINVRQAFNSPFRPFVLASTSIGQEGLDFHLYCKKIFHWNLPGNPIDFEQREGRIHRYKGLVIRHNLVDKYKSSIKEDFKGVIWNQIFDAAAPEKDSNKSKCDLVPFWHTETNNNIKIERFVPIYPFSRDIEKYSHMLKVLTYYRLTFGQPRQDELIEALAEYENDPAFKNQLDALMINLSPINFKPTLPLVK